MIAVLFVVSIYVGLEIDYRHWTWVVFLVILPLALAVILALSFRKNAPTKGALTPPQRGGEGESHDLQQDS